MNISLLEQTECLTFLFAEEMSSNIEKLQVNKPGLTYHAIPSFDDMVRGPSTYFPFKKPFESARWDPILLLCSSGSTGKLLFKLEDCMLICSPKDRQNQL